MNIRILLTLIISTGFYVEPVICMMSRTAQQTSKAIPRTAPAISRLAYPALGATVPARGLTTQSATHYFTLASFKERMGDHPMPTYQTGFRKPWATGARPWEILGVSRGASLPEAQKAYRLLIQKVHPDKNPNNFQEATLASQELSDALAWFKGDRSYSDYEYYKRKASQALNGIYLLLISVIGLKTAQEFHHLIEKKKVKNAINKLNDLYNKFEASQVPDLMLKQFTAELEALKNELELAINKTKESGNKKEMSDLLKKYINVLNDMLATKEYVLNYYLSNKNAVDFKISQHKELKSEHQKMFGSHRSSAYFIKLYQLPSLDKKFFSTLEANNMKLYYDIETEKLKQKQKEEEEKRKRDTAKTPVKPKQSYTDLAKGYVYYYWNRLKNAMGFAK